VVIGASNTKVTRGEMSEWSVINDEREDPRGCQIWSGWTKADSTDEEGSTGVTTLRAAGTTGDDSDRGAEAVGGTSFKFSMVCGVGPMSEIDGGIWLVTDEIWVMSGTEWSAAVPCSSMSSRG
jgi:hypothetical protein